MTYSEIYSRIYEELASAGFGEAKSDALLLLDYIGGITREDLFARGSMELSEATESKLLSALQKRLTHMPVQHITGYQNFMGLEFAVDENVLIPRYDTEILVEEILKDGGSGLNILDMCTGSGCLLISLLKYMNDCKGIGTDISYEALEVAKQNAKRLEVESTFIQSNMFDNISENEKFDLIVSNPPYIRSDVIPTLMEEVRAFEPVLALDGDEDGLKFYRIIIEKSRKYLNRSGKLFFEIGYDQGESVKNLMEAAGFKDVTVVKDFSGLDRVVSGINM